MAKKPHIPAELPPKINYTELIRQLGDTHRAVGALDTAWLHRAVNIQLLLTPLLTKEAVASSQIEGTRATAEDVFRYEAENEASEDSELSRDVRETLNYRLALQRSLEELKQRTIGENLIKKAHSILLDSVRGANKDRGNFRREVVYIGDRRSDIAKAKYIPPPPQEIPRLIKNWEKYINDDQQVDALVQIAVAHYQFEAIHPFKDGNGRIGRLLIPIFLCQRQMLDYPILYVSGYLESNRDDYISLMRGVDQEEDWIPWIRFMLHAIEIQALSTQTLVLKILSLYNDLQKEIADISSPYARTFLDVIFRQPIVSFGILKGMIGAKSPQTVYNLLEKFVARNILSEPTAKARNRIFVFARLLSLLRTSA